MIEVRIEHDWMQQHQHNILHSILMMEALRTAGLPVIGKIIFHGPARGTMITTFEDDLDGGAYVIHWYDKGEPGNGKSRKMVASGSGKGYTWRRYENPLRPDRRHLMWHDDSDSYFEVFSQHEADRHMESGCDDVTGSETHETNFMRQQEADW